MGILAVAFGPVYWGDSFVLNADWKTYPKIFEIFLPEGKNCGWSRDDSISITKKEVQNEVDW
jgi:hypothetical protein